MSDTVLDDPERLNYFKLLIVVTEIGVLLTRKILDIHLKKIGKTLQTFIDENRHEIYHCFDKRKCCQCQSNNCLASETILKEPQMRLMFDKSRQRKNGHRSENNNKWCCCEVNAIDIENLDLSFLRFFLFNFCEESLWDIDLTECQESFNEILNGNKHDIYHLLHVNIQCCACRLGYNKPKSFITLDSKDFEKMFTLSKRTKCHAYCICVYDAENGLSHTELKKRCNKDTFKQLTRSFCIIRQTIEKVVMVRNDLAHVYGIQARVSEDKFKKEWNILWPCIQAMGKVTGLEEWTNEQIDRVKTCTFNCHLCNQMHMKLLQEAERSEDIIKRLDRQCEILQLIGDNVKLLVISPNNMHNDHNLHKKRRTENDLCPSQCIDILEDGNWKNNPEILPCAIEYIRTQLGYELDHDRVQTAKLVIKLKPTYTENETKDHNDLLSGTLRRRADTAHANYDVIQSSESDSDQDVHTCKCRKEFNSLDAFVRHKPKCQYPLKAKQQKTKNKTDIKKGTRKTDSTEQVKITITPDNNNPRLERWMVNLKQNLQSNPELTDTEDMQSDLPEDGSLVVWAKMTSSVLKEKEKFENTVEKYVKNMFQILPFSTDQETKLNIKIDVLNGMEGYEVDELDSFNCGRCKETFHVIDSFCSHKRECNRKSHEQKARKQKQYLDNSTKKDYLKMKMDHLKQREPLLHNQRGTQKRRIQECGESISSPYPEPMEHFPSSSSSNYPELRYEESVLRITGPLLGGAAVIIGRSVLHRLPSTNMTNFLQQSNRNNPWNKLFLIVSKEVIAEWKNVGRFLQIGENDINIIDANHHDVQEKAYLMLLKWQECKGHAATKDVLIKALKDCELKRVAEIVQEYCETEDDTDAETKKIKLN